MNTMNSKVLMGTISCIAPTTLAKNERILMHQKQLGWLSNINQWMSNKGEQPIPYFRVKQGWEPETAQSLNTSLEIESFDYEKPISPGAARNVLLREFYSSDADWLICMDDDHGVIPWFRGYELFWDLRNGIFDDFLKKQFMITAIPGYWKNTPKEIYKRLKEKGINPYYNWILRGVRMPGSMPVACIPNIKKHKGIEVYFDESSVTGESFIPEDLKFMIDWVLAGGHAYECMNMIGFPFGNLDASSIFESNNERNSRVKDVLKWSKNYLEERLPDNPELWRSRNFFRDRNNDFTHIVHRKRYKEV